MTEEQELKRLRIKLILLLRLRMISNIMFSKAYDRILGRGSSKFMARLHAEIVFKSLGALISQALESEKEARQKEAS